MNKGISRLYYIIIHNITYKIYIYEFYVVVVAISRRQKTNKRKNEAKSSVCFRFSKKAVCYKSLFTFVPIRLLFSVLGG